MSFVQKVTFTDGGQDFMEWYIREGVVIDCQPYQGRVWVGAKVEYPEGPYRVGSIVHYRMGQKGDLKTIKYPVRSVMDLDAKESAEVVGYARKWAKIKGIDESDLSL